MSDKRRTSRENEVPKSRRKVDASRRASTGTGRTKAGPSPMARAKSTTRSTVKSARSGAKVDSKTGARARSTKPSKSPKISAKRTQAKFGIAVRSRQRRRGAEIHDSQPIDRWIAANPVPCDGDSGSRVHGRLGGSQFLGAGGSRCRLSRGRGPAASALLRHPGGPWHHLRPRRKRDGHHRAVDIDLRQSAIDHRSGRHGARSGPTVGHRRGFRGGSGRQTRGSEHHVRVRAALRRRERR